MQANDMRNIFFMKISPEAPFFDLVLELFLSVVILASSFVRQPSHEAKYVRGSDIMLLPKGLHNSSNRPFLFDVVIIDIRSKVFPINRCKRWAIFQVGLVV
jgi:hypothetical protein